MPEYTLFNKFPQLEKVLPRKQLGNWPTPLHPLNKLANALGGPQIWIKRDDLSNNLYGGNKARKLEFVIARAEDLGSGEIITAGGLGSNHILATAALTKQAGYRVTGLFFCQPVNEHVRRNLLMEICFGTEMHFVRDYPGLVRGYIKHYLQGKLAGRRPLILMPGGSDQMTTIGYLNCMLEIKDQLETYNLPQPEAIFTAAGTGGTAAGLLAGLSLTGSGEATTTLHAVRVVQPAILNEQRIVNLAAGALKVLSCKEKTINSPNAKDLMKNLLLEKGYLGEGYGFPTAKTAEAITLFRDLEGIELEGCYTAKAAAALIDYCRDRDVNNSRPVIFIYTAANSACYNYCKIPSIEEIPAEFQWCFSDKARKCSCGLHSQNIAFCSAIRQPGWHWQD